MATGSDPMSTPSIRIHITFGGQTTTAMTYPRTLNSSSDVLAKSGIRTSGRPLFAGKVGTQPPTCHNAIALTVILTSVLIIALEKVDYAFRHLLCAINGKYSPKFESGSDRPESDALIDQHE